MYIIYRSDIDMYCRWNENVILFDTREEAVEFIRLVPYFFELASEVKIVPIPKDMALDDMCVIRFQDIDKDELEHDKQAFEALKEQDKEMRGVLKDE